MGKRIKVYYSVLRWTAFPLLILMWFALMSGPATFKSDLVRKWTLGLINPAAAGKLHSVWLPPVTGLVFYVHVTMGFLVIVNRLKWLKPKIVWEVVSFLVGSFGLLQFFGLYYG